MMDKFITIVALFLLLFGLSLFALTEKKYFVVCDMQKNTIERINDIPHCIPKKENING